MSIRTLSLLILATILSAACRDVTSDHIEPSATGQPGSTQVTADAEVVATVDQVLNEAKHPAIKWPNLRDDVAEPLKTAYAAEADRLLWFDDGTATKRAEAALETVTKAGDYGLDPVDYDSAWLTEQWTVVRERNASPRDRASFDLALSIAAARMMRAVHAGRVDPATMNWGYDTASKTTDIPGSLAAAKGESDLDAVLEKLEPTFNHYKRNKTTLALYKTAMLAGEPPLAPQLSKGTTKIVPAFSLDRPPAGQKDSWDGVPALVARLKALGDLAGKDVDAVAAPLYTGAIVEAVKAFQTRHGLTSDGVIGASTIKAINVPLAQRVRQLELAIERGRWLPALGDKPNVFINVAQFRMWATDPRTGEEPLRMNVVVGKALNTQTPIFVDQMEYVVFRPYWNPPPSIVKGEIIPALRKSAGYLDKENMEIVASGADNAPTFPVTNENIAALASGKLTVRQRPGDHNALGLAKFIFPNSDNVYMHGTPAQALFARTRRDFSHGCIRLEDPTKFAEWVLRDDPSWTRERIEAAMNGSKPQQVNLKEKVTVVVFYDTVHVNSENVVFFVDDIYGHDKSLDAALLKGYPYAVKPPAKRATKTAAN